MMSNKNEVAVSIDIEVYSNMNEYGVYGYSVFLARNAYFAKESH